MVNNDYYLRYNKTMKSMKKINMQFAFERVGKRNSQIALFKHNEYKCEVQYLNAFTVVLLFKNKSLVSTGVAKRNPNDEYNACIGFNIALIRAVEALTMR